MWPSPGPPTRIEPGGTYAHSPSPGPPYLGKRISKDIPPISVIGYRWPLQKTPPFPGFLGKSSRDYGKNIPPFPEKLGSNAHEAPLCIRVGVWGQALVFESTI